jgi:hypothetical protein
MFKFPKVEHHKVELVVAHHKENLAWLKKIQHHKTIYHKGNLGIKDAINLPNIGRESHTYLRHIVDRYKCLADITLFCQGNPFDHCPNILNLVKFDSIEEINKAQNRPPNPHFAPLSKILWPESVQTLEKNPWDSIWRLPFIPTIFDLYFPQHIHPTNFLCIWGAMFAISKEQIHQFSRDTYRELLHLHEQNWSLPWAMEIIWLHLFHPDHQPERTIPII